MADGGLDCSGFLYLGGVNAGIPGIKRTTAERMALGLDGWKGVDVPVNDLDEMVTLYWKWDDKKKATDLPAYLLTDKEKPSRTIDHVGVVVIGRKSGLFEIAHAGKSKGIACVPAKGVLIGVTKARKLTIGDKTK